ncbi:MAG: CDP-diacylglycerol--serine O-phosphatidyltransferase, partial [Verrucomicrobiota bacterium]|nr:CDP-diacylglycerol--serine O-phosphatidyltransferase [Verrucomicrobiota bacterium]
MSEKKSAGEGNKHEPKIYFLPNLFTAGNLFCGFLALTKIVEAPLSGADPYGPIEDALLLILLACILDALDGRVARMGGYESPFGREFDSITDIVSFGVAPAFLVHRVVLKDVFVAAPEIGWFIASVYVICGALRLARFNCIAASEEASGEHSREFVGFPIPVAAGLVASITYFLIWMEEGDFAKGSWKYALPVLLVFLSAMMVSRVSYPTFKRIDWRAPRSFTKMVFAAMLMGFLFTVGRRYLP